MQFIILLLSFVVGGKIMAEGWVEKQEVFIDELLTCTA